MSDYNEKNPLIPNPEPKLTLYFIFHLRTPHFSIFLSYTILFFSILIYLREEGSNPYYIQKLKKTKKQQPPSTANQYSLAYLDTK